MISVGIDIGQFSIKVAEVEPTGRDYKLIQTRIFPIPQDPNRDQRLEMVEVLRSLAAHYQSQSVRFVVGIPQSRVTVRRKIFPFKERHKILKSLPFEMEDEIPFTHEDSFFDGKITRFINATSEVIAVAAPRPVISDILSLCHDGGIEPDVLSVSGVALSTLFESLMDPPPQETAEEHPIPEPTSAEVILNLGHHMTELIAHHNGRLLDARSIDWGGKDIAVEIAKNYNLPMTEALKELQSKGYVLLNEEGATRDQVAFSEVIKTGLRKLAQELHLTVMDMQTSNKIKIDDLTLVGGASYLKNIGPFLTQQMSIRTNRLSDTLMHPQLSWSSSPNQEPITCTAIALALEGIKRPRNPAINLLKGEFTRQSQNLKIFWDKWGHTVQVATAMLVALLTWGIIRENMATNLVEQTTERLERMGKNIPGMKGRKANLMNAQRYVGEQQQQIKMRRAAEDLNKINSALDLVRQVSDASPQKSQVKMNVLRFSIDNELVVIEGEVEKSNMVQSIQNQLRSVALNGRVQVINSTNRVTPGWVPFSFSFTMPRLTGGP